MTQPNTKPYVELEPVIDKLSATVSNADKYYTHMVAGTLDDYYADTLEAFAIELMLVPIDRVLSGLNHFDDPHHVAAAVEKAAQILACTFNKSQHEVHSDLNACVEKLPVSDYREAKVLRSRGQLN